MAISNSLVLKKHIGHNFMKQFSKLRKARIKSNYFEDHTAAVTSKATSKSKCNLPTGTTPLAGL